MSIITRGNIKTELAKIGGMTPEIFTFKGRKEESEALDTLVNWMFE